MKLFNPMSVLKLLINMERHRLFSEDKKVSDIQFDIWLNNIQLPYVLSRIDWWVNPCYTNRCKQKHTRFHVNVR